MIIADFISRCDLYCQDRGVSRVWLSKRLFSDTFKIDQLAAGSADVGVRRLEKADADLRALVSDLHGDVSGSEDGTMAPRFADGAEKSDANISRTEGVAA